MQRIQLQDLDLNLLVVLEVLLRERSVTRASRLLHRTPSAVSHALARLRAALGDELLVREGRALRPTSRGLELADGLPRVLDQVRRALAPPEPFDPAISRRAFRLAAPDFVAAILPSLLASLGAGACGVSVELIGVGPGSATELEEGRLDGLVAPAALRREGLRAEPLLELGWSVFGRAGHPAFQGWSAASWSSWPHLRVRTPGSPGEGPVDRAARALGLTREVRLVVPQFGMAAPVLARSALLLTVPRLALGSAARAHGLEERPVPFPLEPLPLALHRSALLGREPGVQWFLGQVSAAFAALEGTAGEGTCL